MQALCEELGNPQKSFRTIHIAGTNGKGSTAATLESVLRSHGLSTGLYTSPHLIDFAERFRINGCDVDCSTVSGYAGELQQAVEKLAEAGISITFFEAVTALGFLIFRDFQPDWVILEVGMGGRLDATNVVVPEVCAITHVGMDHMAYLGETLEAIAAEKGGIIKGPVPVVVSTQDEGVLRVLRKVAQEKGAPYREGPSKDQLFPIEVSPEGTSFMHEGNSYQSSLVGVHQASNAALALDVLQLLKDQGQLKLDPDDLREGLRKVVWPGRFQVIDINSAKVLDGAHNLQAWSQLRASYNEVFSRSPHRVILGLLNDKELSELCDIAWDGESEFWLVGVDSPRSAHPEEVLGNYRQYLIEIGQALKAERLVLKARTFANIEAALDEDMEIPSSGTLIAGSLYLVGEVLALYRGGQAQHNLNA